MVSCKKWRFQICDPNKSTEWQTVFEVDEYTLPASQLLREELTAMDTPIQVRIVPSSGPKLSHRFH